MSDLDDIEEDGDGGSVEPPTSEDAAALAAPVGACLSCGAGVAGVFCVACGQKQDDLRRSLFVLARDFVEDTFAFDSRMWRTLGVLAASPGLAPTNYAHGKRSRYTPPVRLFLVVSFLFFLTLSLANTLFIAIEVWPKTAEQIESEKQAVAEAAKRLDASGIDPALLDQPVLNAEDDQAVRVDHKSLDCQLNFSLQFFVRASDVKIDQDAWRACAESMRASANISVAEADGTPDAEKTAATRDSFERVMTGVSTVIENPAAFTREINLWLPRVMFFMTPLGALLMGIFIRGKDALFFDHLVMSLYSHAVAFTLAGLAIILTQIDVPFVGFAALAGLFVYSVAALKRAYGRGWVKTVYSTLMIGFLYFAMLTVAVMLIVGRVVLNA